MPLYSAIKQTRT